MAERENKGPGVLDKCTKTFKTEPQSALSLSEPQVRILREIRTSVSDKNRGLLGAVVYPWRRNWA